MKRPEVVSVGDALRIARGRIGAVDARALLRHASGLRHAQLAARPEIELDPQVWLRFQALVARRAAGEPVAYLVGWREFYGRRFAVTPDVLIPRPETELLVDLALQAVGPRPAQVLELGTGSGVLAITLALELPNATLTATDVSPAALEVARGNAAVLGVRVRWVESSWYSALDGERFDLIVSNPPYIAPDDPHLGQGDLRFEPRAALVGRGATGAGDLEQIARDAPAHLNVLGRMILEHGWAQGSAVRTCLAEAGFGAIETTRDIGGNERATAGMLGATSAEAEPEHSNQPR